jgi:hypothetical protein
VLLLLLGVATVWLTWLTATRFCRAGQPCRVGPASAARAGPPFDDGRTGNGGPALAEASWSHPTFGPFLAGLVIACDPILINQQTLVMTETLAAFLAILGLWCLARFDGNRSWFNAALAGGAIGLAVLCRPTFLPWLGLVGLTMLAVRGGPVFSFQFSVFSWRQVGWRVLNAAALGIVAAAVISPWVIRNYRVFGKPIATTTHGGYTLYLGNNEEFYQWLATDQSGLPWDSSRFDLETDWQGTIAAAIEPITFTNDGQLSVNPGYKELFVDAWAYEQANEAIQSKPSMFARASLYRISQLWSPLPNRLTADESTGRRVLRYATCTWYCGVYVLAAIGVWRLRWKLLQPPWIWGVLLCLAFTAVHTFYWTNLRMRAPLMPFVAIVAAAAVRSGDKTERWWDRETERE